MSLIKSRNWTQKEDQDLLTVLNDLEERGLSVTWREISDLVKQRNPSSRKTGKQCRQRWANQLDPKIKRNENWTKAQNQILFRVHAQVGNKWSSICSHLPGRTDNCIKNHFYSTMRRGMRKINSYIQNVKRKTTLAKTFKNEILNKILAICQGKNDDKYQFNKIAKQFAFTVKTNLVALSIDCSDVDDQNVDFKQEIFHQISQFSRNCRKRKTKKQSDMSDSQLNIILDKEAEKNQKDIQLPKQIQQKSKKVYQEIQNKKFEDKINLQQKKQKYIKIPLLHIKKPGQLNGLQKEGVLMKKQKNYNQNIQSLKNIIHQNPFSLIYSNSSHNMNYNYNLTNQYEEKCQQILKSSQKGEISFFNSFTDLAKSTQVPSFKNIESAVIQVDDQNQNIQQTNKIFPSLIQSQDFQLNHNYNLTKKQNTSITSLDFNAGVSFSPVVSSSPFIYYGAPFGFANIAWTQNNQKYRTATSMIQLGENTQKIGQKNKQKSSFKLVKRSSLQSFKLNSVSN